MALNPDGAVLIHSDRAAGITLLKAAFYHRNHGAVMDVIDNLMIVLMAMPLENGENLSRVF